jgi:glycosyltransferase involved in cell wall biosynthesis
LVISVVTPSFNQGRFIGRTVESVLGQRGDFDLDYYVADGGSTDGTLEILRARGDRLRFVSERDGGPVEALRKGFGAARGEIIGWLNSDDLYAPGALERVRAAFERHPEAQWLCGRCRIIDEQDREVRRPITAYKNFWLKRHSLRKLLALNYISQPAVFLRRRAIEEVGLIEPGYKLAFDYAWWLRLAAKYPPLIVDEYLAAFRAHGGSLGGTHFGLQFREETDAARRANPGYFGIVPLHALHARCVIATYKVMSLARRPVRAPG